MNVVGLLKHYISARYFGRFRSRAHLERFQQKRLVRLLRFVNQKSPFYAEELQGGTSLNDARFVVDKKVMMENFNQINTCGIDKDEAFDIAIEAEKNRDFSPTLNGYTIGLSSGTSGNRGLFLVSGNEQMQWAGTVLAKMLPAPLWRKSHIALFLRANSNLYEAAGRGKVSFRFFDLMDSIESNLQSLEQYQPDLLVAPPSVLRIIARAVDHGEVTLSPSKIVSVAEVLDPVDREYMSSVFKQRIHQIYQATEGFLGHTCEHGVLHLNEESILIEREYINPEKTRFVPIITDLNRYAQPFIRYRLNDILTLREKACPCGSVMTALDQIEGRCDDVFYLKSISSDQWVTVFPDFIRNAIIAASDGIDEYKVRQAGESLLVLSVTPRAGQPSTEALGVHIEDALSALFERLEVKRPTYEWVAYEPPVGAAKLRRIQRDYQPEGCEML